uniref:Ion_trans_2 domain-containing protein n=1 Tax=Panagrellus redivivus TaxID=6233 RepID=A0A7E4WAR5_PANRE
MTILTWYCCYAFRDWIEPYRRPLAANVACLLFVIIYSTIGGFIFLHFERDSSEFAKKNDVDSKVACVEAIIRMDPYKNQTELAYLITEYCFVDPTYDDRQDWNVKNAMLYAFGIITTLGYGLLWPTTINGRIFTVIYGFFGIPITVIMFTNFGRYLQNLELYVRHKCCLCIRKPKRINDESSLDSLEDPEQISVALLVSIVVLYLVVGAFFIPYLNGQVDFFNGVFYAFLCFTAIEFGELIPHGSDKYIPIMVVIIYIGLGLIISTIAVDIGSTYVRKLYYVGKRIGHIAGVKIWFGSKHLRVRELIVALGQNIGLEPAIFSEINLDQLVSDAIQVKEGKLSRVPQTHMIVEGIWPPELVPLFVKDGHFPEFVDDDEASMISENSPRIKELSPTGKLCANGISPNIAFSLPPAYTNGLLVNGWTPNPAAVSSSRLSLEKIAIPLCTPPASHHGSIRRTSRRLSTTSSRSKGERLTVRFEEDVVYELDDDLSNFDAASVQHVRENTTTDVDPGSTVSDIASSAGSYNLFTQGSEYTYLDEE